MDYKVKTQSINQTCEISHLCSDAESFITSLISKNFPNNDAIFIAKSDAEMEVFEKQLRFFTPRACFQTTQGNDELFTSSRDSFDTSDFRKFPSDSRVSEGNCSSSSVQNSSRSEAKSLKTGSNILEKYEIINFPAWDCLPYDRTSPKQALMSQRIKALYKLANRNIADNRKFLVITSYNAISQKIISPKLIKNSSILATAKSKISISQIAEFLVFNGYTRQSCANNAGEFAIRGGIVDIVVQYSLEAIGYRIDFFGEEIESIRIFDPLTQMSQESVRSIEILPASEVVLNTKTIANFREKYRNNFGLATDDQLYSSISESRSYDGMEHWLPFFYDEELVSFFDYLKNPLLFFNQEIFTLAEARHSVVEEYYKSRLESIKESKLSGSIYNPILPNLLYFSSEEFKKLSKENTAIIFNNFAAADADNKRVFDLEIKTVPDFALAGRANSRDPIDLMQEFVRSIMIDPKKQKVAIACLSEGFKERLKKLLLDFNLSCEEISNFKDLEKIPPQRIAIFTLPIKLGFITSDLILIGEQALFGEKVVRKKSNNKAASERILEEGLTILPGELVVHRDHGIGKFEGIFTIKSPSSCSASLRNDSLPLNKGSLNHQKEAIQTDMIKLIYANNDTLFVPIDDINLITRYGADNPLIQLDRLAGSGWKTRKTNVKKRIKIAAEELLKIAAARHIKKAPILIPESHWYEEFKARFPYVETEDQLKAINEVEEDLAKGSPMDRLICGDVGFGKTEVAMRAAAIATRNETQHYQVAVIAPTTLLTRQHFHNFSKRFAGTDVKIAQLSRLVSAAESKKIKDKLESGEIDIVVGTHALLNKNIKFKNLALVIIDEEQHFGVAQKERLKELRNEVHVLTLSATPIPRTLQMSLTGVKELSLIATPPLDRLAVRNFVMPYDSIIVKEAIMREYQRNGKVFFVVPRVKDIAETEERLTKILPPEIKITHAHGQMTPTELDKIMNDFYDGKIDVLLSTTIIESGIDVASANTIIINRAEMFGLSQLYQLRGRVGRGKIRAYAYFMMSPKKLKDDARKKLEVMQNLDSLGVGFTVASYDMDIRGSGNLLGEEQSGHVRETGVELYQQMLLETISDLKNNTTNISEEKITEDFSVQIKLGISLLIPENYVADLGLRMSFYKKIMMIKNDDDQENLVNEMNDRFGVILPEVVNLMEISKLKHACKKVGVEKLEAVIDGILISFKDNKFAAPEKLMEIIFNSKNQIKLQQSQKILHLKDVKSVANKINSAFEVIAKLNSLIIKN
ncbi:MAG: transcription-repair coupling factor [Rickettsiales bacterium]|nr:transcription-repair coupling factor [Rickettsiales bacterium]